MSSICYDIKMIFTYKHFNFLQFPHYPFLTWLCSAFALECELPTQEPNFIAKQNVFNGITQQELLLRPNNQWNARLLRYTGNRNINFTIGKKWMCNFMLFPFSLVSEDRFWDLQRDDSILNPGILQQRWTRFLCHALEVGVPPILIGGHRYFSAMRWRWVSPPF